MAKKQFKAESRRLMELMINSIYTNKEIFLREIISNASDAMDKLAYKSLTDDKVGLNREDFKITIKADKESRNLTISDNGIGMTGKELEENLGIIAKSGSLKFKEELKEADDTQIIGQFGVGFYSAFMVADKVTVISKAYGAETANRWVSSGVDGYTIEECDKESVGTDIIIEIKPDKEDEDYSVYLEDYTLKGLIRKYSDYIRFPIVMASEDEDNDFETVNSMVPIWQRNKSDVSDEEYFAYYKEKYYAMEDPVSVLRVSAEGAAISYTALLFIPEKAPYDYYSKDYKAGLQLYTNGVMIMENCTELLPEHFRFVRGVVDSSDLSLNISREMLQHDRQLKTIASSLEKKVKSELKRLQDKEPEKYDSFYESFGLQLKYGILQEFGAKRELLSDLLMFYSSKNEKPITLSQYVGEMGEAQTYIYYACGADIGKVSNLPQLEPVRDAGYDILYMTDDVDEFVVQMLGNFSEKEFKSVNDDDLGLAGDEAKKVAEQLTENNRELLDFVAEVLGDEVKSAKISGKLKSHPVCLSTEGEMSLEMEKYFAALAKSHGEKEPPRAQRVLELNAEHKAFEALKTAFESDKERAEKLAVLLYNQALLMADMPLNDPARYSELVWELM